MINRSLGDIEMKRSTLLTAMALLFLVMLSFQNCGQGFSSSAYTIDSNLINNEEDIPSDQNIENPSCSEGLLSKRNTRVEVEGQGYNHFGMVHRTQSGKLISIYRKSDNHFDSGQIVYKVSVDDGKSWGQEIEFSDPITRPEQDYRDPNIGEWKNGTILVTYSSHIVLEKSPKTNYQVGLQDIKRLWSNLEYGKRD